MLKRIEHLGIAVSDFESTEMVFESLLGAKAYKTEIVESEGVETMFFKIGESKIELLRPTNSESPIAKFLEKQKGGIHHIAFETDDIDAELARLKEEGYELIHQTPKGGADNKRIAFLHPKSTARVLVELCQDAK
ncbi:MAG: methylmalonyl-CoA epimerase [Flavobacteriales bacterium]|nr:methylmalonyl-CoA epimerase [Flavobacteriales bacterium]